MKTNAQLQKEYRDRMKARGFECVPVWRPKGTKKEFQAEHCLSKTLPDLRKKSPD